MSINLSAYNATIVNDNSDNLIIMNNGNNNQTTSLPSTQQYTIVTDSGGISGDYTLGDSYNHTVEIPNGHKAYVYTLLDDLEGL